MNTAALPRNALRPPRADGVGSGLAMSLLVHVGLVIAIAIGVHWRSRPPEAMSAELWAAVPVAEAPRAVEPEPPKPTPQPRPEPQPQPQPKPVPDAQIAIEKARQDKLRQQREDEARAQEAERQKRLDAQKAEKAKKADDAQREAERQKQMQRIMGLAGASGDAHATGPALQSAGPSASYGGRIKAKIKPNIVFSDDAPANATAEVEVQLAPDGSIVGTPRLRKSSGIPAWDDAVVRAVVKTEVLPRDIDGRVPPSIVIAFRPRE